MCIRHLLICSQELFPSPKYKIKNEEDNYQLIIVGPKVEDTGKYTLEISGISCTALLNVDGKRQFFRTINN